MQFVLVSTYVRADNGVFVWFYRAGRVLLICIDISLCSSQVLSPKVTEGRLAD